MGEIVFLLIFSAIAGYMYFLTGSFRISKMDISGGAAMFPRIVIIIFLACIALRIVQLLKSKDTKEFVWKNIFKKGRREFVISLVLYALLLVPFGFIISTILFLLSIVNYFYFLGNETLGSVRNIVIRNLLLVGFTVALYFIFSEVLGVSLPPGILDI
ncbi:MAG: tripartite tricarboxylate transporter TctB family protein [Spirochaetales bacterium]|nr:tripartite tricarboxylate transporter TctB family protein [Spirochaetales bacterium]